MSLSYCSVANPATGCKPIAGIAIPMNAETLEVFKNLQRQLNRVLSSKKKKLLDVDGRIGPGTVAAIDVARASGTVTGALLGQVRTIDTIAANAPTVLLAVQGLANSLSSPPVVADPKPSSPPSLPGPGGTVMHPPAEQMAASLGGISLTHPLVIGAVGVGILLLLNSKRPRRRARRR